MQIVQWTENDAIPYRLLYLADPDKDMIDRYFFRSDVFLLKVDKDIVGVVCIQSQGKTAEIMNIAISPTYQGARYGTNLINCAIKHVKKLHKDTLLVKTANSSIQALTFYKKNGFKITKIVPNYFVENYAQPIWEDGIQAQDQIILSLNLHE
ncbi:GNAT family N-acetyltransferase [Listeria booriae]|uniref:GNAT family N-acetyltransferase n=1 Tax=Listeria booriae TaxID=1552123 RepID=UPI00163D77B2|nr:GNAT family N-acetyltransferase [Listeria booriae]MBC1307996.1 GNAT family N-acetyltransferase [Listeria booriae]